MSYLLSKKMHEDNLHQEIDKEVIKKSIDSLIEGKPIIEMKTLSRDERAFMKQLNRLHQLPPFNPQTMVKLLKDENINWDRIVDILSKDTFTLASHNALTRKGFEIYKALKEMGIKNPEAALGEILEPMAREASAIKQRQENTSPNNDEVLASTPEKFDTDEPLTLPP